MLRGGAHDARRHVDDHLERVQVLEVRDGLLGLHVAEGFQPPAREHAGKWRTDHGIRELPVRGGKIRARHLEPAAPFVDLRGCYRALGFPETLVALEIGLRPIEFRPGRRDARTEHRIVEPRHHLPRLHMTARDWHELGHEARHVERQLGTSLGAYAAGKAQLPASSG